MKVTLFVRESRAKSSKGSAQLPLIICFRNGKMNLWQTTRLSVNPDWWDQDHQQLKARMAFNPKQRQEFDNEVFAIRKYVSDAFYDCKDASAINHDWLEKVVKKYYKEKDNMQKEVVQPVENFEKLFDAFLDSKMRADSRRKQYLVVKRTLQRYELFKRYTGRPRFRLDIKSLDQATMEDIAAYMRQEHIYYSQYPKTAKAILAKYKDFPGEKLLPFIPSQQYNEHIRYVLQTVGINRIVTILNPLTGKEEKKAICDVATSHMARRTFIGNLYKKVQDPNIVASLSGHACYDEDRHFPLMLKEFFD